MEEEIAVKKAVSELIGCTRRKHQERPKNIIEIAELIEFLRAKLGTYKSVAERVGVSTEMLSEFRSVRDLVPEVRQLVSKRVIDSVDLVYRISKLKPETQEAIVRQVLEGVMTGNDVRVVKSSIAGRMPEKTALLRTIKSRNIKRYLIRFQMPKGKSAREVRRNFSKIIGVDDINFFKTEKGVVTLGVSSKGLKRLSEAAKRENKTLRKFVMSILERESEGGNKI